MTPPTWIDASASPGFRERRIKGWLYQAPTSEVLGQVHEHGGELLARVKAPTGRYDMTPMEATPENLRMIMEDIERIVRGERIENGGQLPPPGA